MVSGVFLIKIHTRSCSLKKSFVRYLIITWFLAGPFIMQAQPQTNLMPAMYTRLGAYSKDRVDLFSGFSNQAALSNLKNSSFGIYHESRFLLKELSFFKLAAGIITSTGNFGFHAASFGFNNYRVTGLGIAYGRKLNERIDIGIQFEYTGVNIRGYGRSTDIHFEGGVIIHLNDKLHSGLHIKNPVGIKLRSPGNATRLNSFGFGYEASEKFFVGLEFMKEENMPIDIITGVQYRLSRQFMVNGGIGTSTSSLYFVLSFFLHRFRFDLIAYSHPYLGITPASLILFTGKKGEK